MYRKTDIEGVEVLDLRAPICVQFELTSNCNYRCVFCYNVWKKSNNNHFVKQTKWLTKEQQFFIIDKIAPVVFSMTLSGGEPTLIPWLPELVGYIVKYKVRCSLITNGALIDANLACNLKEAGLGKVQVSLHHFKDEINDNLTQTRDSIRKTLDGASNLLHFFGKKVNINMVVNKTTVNDVYEMGKFLKQEGFSSFSVGMQSCSGASHKESAIPDSADLILVWRQLSQLADEFDMRTGFVGSTPVCSIPNPSNSKVHFYNMCDAAINQMVISPSGDCRPCVEIPVIGGNIITDLLSQIWNSKPFEEIRMFKNVPSECCKCKFVSTCHGGCRASAYNYTGLLTGKSPLMTEDVPNEFILHQS